MLLSTNTQSNLCAPKVKCIEDHKGVVRWLVGGWWRCKKQYPVEFTEVQTLSKRRDSSFTSSSSSSVSGCYCFLYSSSFVVSTIMTSNHEERKFNKIYSQQLNRGTEKASWRSLKRGLSVCWQKYGNNWSLVNVIIKWCCKWNYQFITLQINYDRNT